MPNWILISAGLVLVLGVIPAMWVFLTTTVRRPRDLALHVLSRYYARGFHLLRVRGRANIREAMGRRPLIVVANHTAGVDPILISTVCPFEIRWVMAEDMRHRSLEWFWRWQRVIFVSRNGMHRPGVREAMAHLKAGGVIGIFPEGGIERPARTLMPFRRGVGLLIKRSGAVVLPFVVEGTPQVEPAWRSLRRPSRSTVRACPMIDYSDGSMSGPEIARDMQARYERWTSWPVGPDQRTETEPDGRTKCAEQAPIAMPGDPKIA